MEIAGQYYAQHLSEKQKILVVRLGGIGPDDTPFRRGSRLWDSHRDLAGHERVSAGCWPAAAGS